MNRFLVNCSWLWVGVIFCLAPQLSAQPVATDDGVAVQALAELSKTEMLSAKMYKASAVEISFKKEPMGNGLGSIPQAPVSEILAHYFQGEQKVRTSTWYQDGDRIRMETRDYWPQGKLRTYELGAYDGATEKHYLDGGSENAGMAFINSGGTTSVGIGDPWLGNLSNPKGLGAFLQQWKPQNLGNEEVSGLKTIKIKVINPEVVYTLWLSPERSFRGVRKRMEIAAPDSPDYASRGVWYETLNYVKFRDIWIPQKGAYMDWLTDRKGTIHWRNLLWFELTNIQSLESDKRSVFDFDIPLGAKVQDSTDPKHLQYSISGSDPRPYLEILQAAEKPIEERMPEDVQEFVKRVVSSVKPYVPGPQEAAQLPRAEGDPQSKIAAPQNKIKVGQAAPDFSVTDADGKAWKLSDLKGKKAVLLTFFPKCFTGGCANHLSSLRDHQAEFDKADVQIFAVSVDPAEGERGQKAFAAQWHFLFPLIPDTQRTLCKLYGAVQQNDERAARMTFLIDKQGIVRFIDTDVHVQTHGADMLAKLRELKMIP